MPKFRPSLLDTLLAGAREPEGEAQQGDSIFPGIRLYSLDRMTEEAYLDNVRRDLSWLLNTVRLDETMDLGEAREVAVSVLNFGIPDFTVRTLASVDVREAAATVSQAIATFEPRIEPRSLVVKGQKMATSESIPSLVFNIVCDVGQKENAIRAGFRTRIDVETGDARLEARR